MQRCKARTPEHWNVLWSDESRLSVWQSDGQVWFWWLPRERYLPDCMVPCVEFGRGGIMGWGYFSGVGLGLLIPVKGTLYAPNFVNLVAPWSWSLCHVPHVPVFPTCFNRLWMLMTLSPVHRLSLIWALLVGPSTALHTGNATQDLLFWICSDPVG